MIELKLGAVSHFLDTEEARALYELLQIAGSVEAGSLAESIGRGLGDAPGRRIQLGLDEIHALREVLCVGDALGHEGLVTLQTAICVDRPDTR